MTALRTFCRAHWWWLASGGIVLLALLLRVAMLIKANWMMDGDEATMAIVGRHIQLQHERPIFFPGQAYMGAWQAYLSALAFYVAGVSRPAAKAVPLISSLAFVLSMLLLARRIYGPKAALVAGAFAALPSVYLLSATLRLSYPLIDVMALGNIILLIAVDSVWRPQPPPRFWLRFLALGLIAGFGFWLHAAIAVFVAPAGLALLVRWPRYSLVPGTPLALAGFVVGAAPVFQFARKHDYTTFDYLFGSSSDTAQRDFLAVARHMLDTVLPRILGVVVPWGPSPTLLQLAIGVPSAAALVYLAWRVRLAPLAWLRARPQDATAEAIVALFGLAVVATYVMSRFSVYALLYPTLDATGRYLAPLGSFLPLAFAGAARDVWNRGSHGRSVAVGGVALLLGATAVAWASAPGDAVFQSPYFRELPRENKALIRALDALDVDAVWINHWAGKPLMFDSDERIAATDWVDLRVCNGIDRLGANSARVFADDDPAFVLISSAEMTPLERALTERGVRFERVSVDGYVVVHPLDGPVDPASVVQYLWKAC